MSKKKGKTPQPAAKKMTASAPKMEAFTFGEPVPVLDRRDILDSRRPWSLRSGFLMWSTKQKVMSNVLFLSVCFIRIN